MSKVFIPKGRSRRVEAETVGVQEADSVEDSVAPSSDDTLDAYIEALAGGYVTLGRRTSRRLAIGWMWAARRHLTLVRRAAGTLSEALDEGPSRAGRPKDGALAGALFLVLLCQELDAVEASDRALLEAAYLPPTGGTDRAPYRTHRLPDGELAARALGSARGQARHARDRLLAVLLELTERWWARFDRTRVRAARRREQFLAHLAWETFTPTVYDVWRLEKLRPEGRGDLDFQRWRGSETMGRHRRGGGPKPPASGVGLSESRARAYVRGELSLDEERDLARHLILHAPSAEIRSLAALAEDALPGGTLFERLRALAAEVSDGAIGFLVRKGNGVPVPAMLDGHPWVLGEGEVVGIRASAHGHRGWVAVLVRVSGGPPEWALRWTRLAGASTLVDVRDYELDDGEDDVDLLVAVVREDPPVESDAAAALAALVALPPGSVRWGARRLVRCGPADARGAP
jgi:hypothetical protein